MCGRHGSGRDAGVPGAGFRDGVRQRGAWKHGAFVEQPTETPGPLITVPVEIVGSELIDDEQNEEAWGARLRERIPGGCWSRRVEREKRNRHRDDQRVSDGGSAVPRPAAPF